jgi:hypothetical protein
LSTEHNVSRAFAHQHLIATDVGLTFRAIEQHRADLGLASARELRARRKRSTAEADDAASRDLLE